MQEASGKDIPKDHLSSTTGTACHTQVLGGRGAVMQEECALFRSEPQLKMVGSKVTRKLCIYLPSVCQKAGLYRDL